jgi:selenide,water dikinase
VQTIDFFTPIVDDPYLFGQIAAVNALSDIYAMGAKPVSALNIACFPDAVLDSGLLADILQGGADKIAESGAVVIGGHSIKDNELKYGLAVTGLVHPQQIKTNINIQQGDRLLLTKPIGTGVLTTALKYDFYSEKDIQNAILSMLTLNRDPSDLLEKYNASAVTDITGFGLLGHLWEMISGKQFGARLFINKIPFFENALPLARDAKYIPAGTLANIKYTEPFVDLANIPVWYLNLLADPQTSGGLLISIPTENVAGFQADLSGYAFEAREIGEIITDAKKIMIV